MQKTPTQTETETSRERFFSRRFVLCLLAVGLCSFLLSMFVVRLGFVNGSSMEGTLHGGQVVLVWQLGYSPAAGDVVVTSRQNPLSKHLTKRVVATGGQLVEIQAGELYVDGFLQEPPPQSESPLSPEEAFSLLVPEGHCFLLGDNRQNSTDSREIGPIPNEEILGVVVLPSGL